MVHIDPVNESFPDIPAGHLLHPGPLQCADSLQGSEGEEAAIQLNHKQMQANSNDNFDRFHDPPYTYPWGRGQLAGS